MDWVFFGASVAFAFLASLNAFAAGTELIEGGSPWKIAWMGAATLVSWAFSLFLLMGAMGLAFNLADVGSKQ